MVTMKVAVGTLNGRHIGRFTDLRPHRRDDASRLPQAGDARRGDPRTAEPIA